MNNCTSQLFHWYLHRGLEFAWDPEKENKWRQNGVYLLRYHGDMDAWVDEWSQLPCVDEIVFHFMYSHFVHQKSGECQKQFFLIWISYLLWIYSLAKRSMWDLGLVIDHCRTCFVLINWRIFDIGWIFIRSRCSYLGTCEYVILYEFMFSDMGSCEKICALILRFDCLGWMMVWSLFDWISLLWSP
jgi:hypothetical protein